MKIVHYATAEQLARCYPLMRALRGRLADEAQFIACWKILSTAASATSMTW